jgi:glycerol transport system permease protein
MRGSRMRGSLGRPLGMALYMLFLLIPIYWLINMSFKTNTEIMSGLSLWPEHPVLDNFRKIFIDPDWHASFINSISFVALNTVVSVTIALPAAMPSAVTGSSATSPCSSGCCRI